MAATIVACGFIGLVIMSAISLYLISRTLTQLTELYNIDVTAAQNARAALMTSLKLVTGAAVAALFSVFLTVVHLSHRIYGPIVAFELFVKKLIAGDFSARVNLRERDEFEELAVTLNALAATLEERAASR